MSFFPPASRFMHSFRIRIFLAMTLIIVMVIPGTGYFCYLQATRIIQKQMQEFAVGSADQISKRVESFLSRHTFNVKLIKAFFEAGLIDMGDDREILRYFSLFQKGHPEFFNITFGDENGRFLMSPAQIPEVNKTFDPRVRPWYQGALTSLTTHWTDVYLFASTQKPGMTVSVPIYDDTRHLQAVCGIDIDISSFSRFLQGIKIGSQGVAYIFDRENGRIIAHPALARRPWQSFHIDLLRQVHQELKGQGQRFGITQYQGSRYFTAYTHYPDSRWTVGVTLPVSDLFENVQSIRRAIISLVVGGILLASLLSYLIAMTIVRPLTRLKQGIERIASGDLDHKVAINDPDIAAALARSYNQMAASLNQSTRELKQTYEALAQKKKLAAVGQMTAGIAHEIKNPLGIIQGAAQVTANPDRPKMMREQAARFIMDEVERLNHTLTVFLDFAKPPSPRFTAVDPVMAVRNILDTLELQYPCHRFILTPSGDIPLIRADADQLRQIFLNLFINGIQAMPENGSLEVRMSSNALDTGRPQVTIKIIDQGTGISQEQLQTIFDPFVSFRDQGIGLGLSVVSQIMKIHGGDIDVDSTPGRGSRFILNFPVEKEVRHAAPDSAD